MGHTTGLQQDSSYDLMRKHLSARPNPPTQTALAGNDWDAALNHGDAGMFPIECLTFANQAQGCPSYKPFCLKMSGEWGWSGAQLSY